MKAKSVFIKAEYSVEIYKAIMFNSYSKTGGVPIDGTKKWAYFPDGIGTNCIYCG